MQKNTGTRLAVRDPGGVDPSSTNADEVASVLAHPSKLVVAQLNEHWRVIDDPLQWILQQRKGNARSKNSGWRNRSFCRNRDGLLRCIREYCCLPDHGQRRCISEYRGVDEAALKNVLKLPEWHVDK
jgi:hypothetical protein